MIWEIEIRPKDSDLEKCRVNKDFHLLTPGAKAKDPITSASKGLLVSGEISIEQIQKLVTELLVDSVVESGTINKLGNLPVGEGSNDPCIATVLLKPGVMDPTALSIIQAGQDLKVPVVSVRSFRRYFGAPLAPNEKEILFRRVLANDAIEMVVEGPINQKHIAEGAPYVFKKIVVPIRDLKPEELEKLSKQMSLSLNREEMLTIQEHYLKVAKDPNDIELETIAQTWSEHCSHKTLKGRVDFEGKIYQNLLKETIFEATRFLREKAGKDDWCVSVFEDNAGVIKFDENFHLCFKVETHNRPSAIEPYGGANTGIGGVIRDPMGTGLGAKPVCNTDIFCFAPPDTLASTLPEGILHPLKIMTGVVSGVRDYGNRMGIPTINGAVCFHDRYLGNPLVFCGTAGLIPVDKAVKKPLAGDFVVAVGGRTGRDGIHGATFSSAELNSDSEKVSGGAVQIGNAIEEKKVLDAILKARDLGLYSSITDCGAGGFSSAVGEMGEHLGASIQLDQAPLKYAGLSYTEIWISESQERMILSVPKENLAKLKEVCKWEGVEAVELGVFENTGRLKLFYQGTEVGDIELDFLHNGRPKQVRKAAWKIPPESVSNPSAPIDQNLGETLLKLLSSLNICSKEWIIRQYDHEVQGGSVIKPLVGILEEGPSDASVVMPVLGSTKGFAVGCGILPDYGDLDPYAMAACAIDEAVRNVVAVGADPSRIAILDNFCWGNTDRPEVLGSLVMAAEACKEFAITYEMPFISGKDSLKNEFHAKGKSIVIPPTLLISAIGIVQDVRQCVTMDMKKAGNKLFLVGRLTENIGGSQYAKALQLIGGIVPRPDAKEAIAIHKAMHGAITAATVRSCHDVSEGGIAVTIAEMAFAGGIGADIHGLNTLGNIPFAAMLFAEPPTCYVVEIEPQKVEQFQAIFKGLPVHEIGTACVEKRLRFVGPTGEWALWTSLEDLRKAWLSTLKF